MTKTYTHIYFRIDANGVELKVDILEYPFASECEDRIFDPRWNFYKTDNIENALHEILTKVLEWYLNKTGRTWKNIVINKKVILKRYDLIRLINKEDELH